jgi:hypothetical protein
MLKLLPDDFSSSPAQNQNVSRGAPSRIDRDPWNIDHDHLESVITSSGTNLSPSWNPHRRPSTSDQVLLFSRSVALAQRRKGPAHPITQASLILRRPSSAPTERVTRYELGRHSMWLNRPGPVKIVAGAAFGA